MIFAIEAIIAHREVELMTPGELIWRVTKWSSTNRTRDCEILCVGDSQIKQSVLPHILEARTGKKAYNLATVGGYAASTYFMLKRALDAGANPSTVIVGFKPCLLEHPADFGRRIWAEGLDFGEAVEATFVEKDSDALAALSLMKTFPSIRNRNAIRTRVLDTVQGGFPADPLPTLALSRNANRNRGALLLEKNPYYLAPLTSIRDDDRTYSAHADVLPANAYFLHRFLEMTASRGIAVYWVLPPIDEYAQDWRERRGFEADYDRFLDHLLSLYSNLTIVDARHSHYGPEALWDPTHLNHKGASAFSEDLAELLRRESPNSRWYQMPSFTERPEQAPSERLDLISLMERTRR